MIDRDAWSQGTAGTKAVYGLVSNLAMATRIAKSAAHCRLQVHNFDKADALLNHTKEKIPALIILDWDGCEAEAFKVLKELGQNADLMKVTAVGFSSKTQGPLPQEAQRAGCLRVYTKTEFGRSLDDLMARYAL